MAAGAWSWRWIRRRSPLAHWEQLEQRKQPTTPSLLSRPNLTDDEPTFRLARCLAMFVDVQGNYFVVKAYQYSSITSVTLLDCWTVLWVMILTWYELGTRYSFSQFLGAGTCVAGLGHVLLSDAKSPDKQGIYGL
ncbi:hypothetical protein D1007_44420 [Hordeum vulgare]|nr:hypothetical protein D1007_44420 [Hordeum vulgare]